MLVAKFPAIDDKTPFLDYPGATLDWRLRRTVIFRNATFGYQADVDRSEQSYSSPPGAVHLRGVPDSLVHRLCTGNAVYEIVKLHIGRMFFPQWVGTDTLHLLSVIQKFFYFFKSLCNSTSGTMPKTCYINLTITIHKK